MSWGALNNQKNRNSTDPLPEFLTTEAGRSHLGPQPTYGVSLDSVNYQAQHHSSPVAQASDLPTSSKARMSFSQSGFVLFVLVLTASILGAFSFGYLLGQTGALESQTNNIELTHATKESSSTVSRRPLLPSRVKQGLSLASETSSVGGIAQVKDKDVFGEEEIAQDNKNNDEGEGISEEEFEEYDSEIE